MILAGVFASTLRVSAATAEQPIYQSTEVQKEPVPKHEMRIRYSRALRKEHDEVTLRFVVTAAGKVDQITIVKFTDPEIIDPTLMAYQSAEYVPAMKDGKPVAAWVEVTEVAK